MIDIYVIIYMIYREGRKWKVMHHFSGHQSRRACALWGPEGIGKTALGVEFVHFAAAPGRHFSCCARTVHIEAMDLMSSGAQHGRKFNVYII